MGAWHSVSAITTILSILLSSYVCYCRYKQLYTTILSEYFSVVYDTLCNSFNITCLIHHYYMKEPYHTSILSGYACLQELLHGHPECIHTELGVHKEVFHALIRELLSMGHGHLRYETLDEQLAIFLYMSVTGLSICHVGE